MKRKEKTMKIREFDKNTFKRVLEEYKPDRFNDDEYMYLIKGVIRRLSEAEMDMFIYYAEAGTYKAVAKRYNMTYEDATLRIKEIRKKILLCL